MEQKERWFHEAPDVFVPCQPGFHGASEQMEGGLVHTCPGRHSVGFLSLALSITFLFLFLLSLTL